MASQLKVDTLTGVTTAGSIVVTGEGNSTTTNLQQGLAKAWIRFNGASTVAINDSFNMSSLTDNDTGYYSPNYTNSFNSANYSITISSSRDTSNNRLCQHFLGSFTTNNLIYLVNKDNSNADSDAIGETINGDLA